MRVHHCGMSAQSDSSPRHRFHPRVVLALAKIALIGVWAGRTFLDDDADLSDVADLAPVEALPAVVPYVEAPASAPRSVAA